MPCILTIIYMLLSFNAVSNSINSELEEVHRFRQKRQSSNGYQFADCVLPDHPENGKWEVVGGSSKPGATVLPNTLIKFSCNAGFRLTPKNAFYICDADWNIKNMPKCREISCPTMKSTSTTRVECLNSKGEIITCDRAVHGSTVRVKCVQYYELPAGQSDKIKCKEGSSSNIIPQCIPVCGKPVEAKEDLFTGVKTAPTYKYPWIATLYQQMDDELKYICGGTIISDTLIITAAHCVSNPNGEPLEPSNYQISVGKAYNVYGDSRDQMAQYLFIKDIKLHPQYKGYDRNYISDIAVLKTKTPIRISAYVQPICFKGLNDITIPDDAKGAFALWGRNAQGEKPEGLRYFEILNNEQTCENKLPKDWVNNYKLSDKICAYFGNYESERYCIGFSGAGWAFKNPLDSRYYLHGIVSLSPFNSTTRCTEPSVLCTKVSSYYDYIANQLDGL